MNTNKKKISMNIESVLAAVGIIMLCFLVVLKFYTILKINVPRELREATLAVFAKDLANGVNPYAISILEHEIPSATSLYGCFVPMVLAPFVKIFSFIGIGALQTCQIVTLVVEIVGIYFGYKIIYSITNNEFCSICSTIILYSCYWRYDACGGAFPDQWGVTLSIILAYLVYKDEERKRYRPLLYAAIIVVLFYIKSYFVFVTFGLFVYLLINEVKEAIKLVVAGICIGGSSFFWST